MNPDADSMNVIANMMRCMAETIVIVEHGDDVAYLYKFKKYKKIKRTCWIGATLFEMLKNEVAITYEDRGGSRPCNGNLPDLSTWQKQVQHIRGRFVTKALFQMAIDDPYSLPIDEPSHTGSPIPDSRTSPQSRAAFTPPSVYQSTVREHTVEPSRLFDPPLYGMYDSSQPIYGSPLGGMFDAVEFPPVETPRASPLINPAAGSPIVAQGSRSEFVSPIKTPIRSLSMLLNDIEDVFDAPQCSCDARTIGPSDDGI